MAEVHPNRYKKWTEDEQKIAAEAKTIEEAVAKLPGRSASTIKQWRRNHGHPIIPDNDQVMQKPRAPLWSQEEMNKLGECHSMRQAMEAFPDRSPPAIKNMRYQIGKPPFRDASQFIKRKKYPRA